MSLEGHPYELRSPTSLSQLSRVNILLASKLITPYRSAHAAINARFIHNILSTKYLPSNHHLALVTCSQKNDFKMIYSSDEVQLVQLYR